MKPLSGQWKHIILIIFTGAFLAGCILLLKKNHSKSRLQSAAAYNPDQIKAWNKHTVDTAVSLLKSGDVVLRMGLGADSYLLAQMNRKNKTYSHCGIVMMENGYPFVYHSIGGEDNPDERMRRDSACFFFSPLHNSGLAIARYDFTPAEVNNLKQIVAGYYRKRPRFDMKFDLKTDDFLYCAEFVYKAVNKAVNDTSYIGTTSYLGYTFVGTDDLFINKHAHILWQSQFK